MAPRNASQSSGVDKSQFEMVTRSDKPIYRESNRDPMGIYVHQTGLAESNVAGADVFRGAAEAEGLDPKQFAVTCGGDESTNRVLVYVVDPLTDGAVAVRQNLTKKTVTLYLHELFAAKPGLRPDQDRWCTMRPDKDTDGNPCILISLRVALEQRKNKRKAAGPA